MECTHNCVPKVQKYRNSFYNKTFIATKSKEKMFRLMAFHLLQMLLLLHYLHLQICFYFASLTTNYMHKNPNCMYSNYTKIFLQFALQMNYFHSHLYKQRELYDKRRHTKILCLTFF